MKKNFDRVDCKDLGCTEHIGIGHGYAEHIQVFPRLETHWGVTGYGVGSIFMYRQKDYPERVSINGRYYSNEVIHKLFEEGTYRHSSKAHWLDQQKEWSKVYVEFEWEMELGSDGCIYISDVTNQRESLGRREFNTLRVPRNEVEEILEWSNDGQDNPINLSPIEQRPDTDLTGAISSTSLISNIQFIANGLLKRNQKGIEDEKRRNEDVRLWKLSEFQAGRRISAE